MIETEHHPNWYYPINDMRTLILGTFPPHRERWDYPFFYPNKANFFWRSLAAAGKVTLKEWQGEAAVRERKQLMERLRVGVQNMGLVIERTDKSALDNNIAILEYQDILGTLTTSPKLKKVLLTGYSGKTSTYRALTHYLKNHGVDFSRPPEIKAMNEFVIYLDKPVTCILGNSTSPTAQRGGVTFEALVKQFKYALS